MKIIWFRLYPSRLRGVGRPPVSVPRAFLGRRAHLPNATGPEPRGGGPHTGNPTSRLQSIRSPTPGFYVRSYTTFQGS